MPPPSAGERHLRLVGRARSYPRAFLGAAAAAVVVALIVVGLAHLPRSTSSASSAAAARTAPTNGAASGSAALPPGVPVFDVAGEVTPAGISAAVSRTPQLRTLVAAVATPASPASNRSEAGATTATSGSESPVAPSGVPAESEAERPCLLRASSRPELHPVALLDGTVGGSPARVLVTVGGPAPRNVALWTFTPDCGRLLGFEQVTPGAVGLGP